MSERKFKTPSKRLYLTWTTALLTCFLISSYTAIGQTRSTEYRFKSGYLNNFINLVKWPKVAVQDTFRIGIVKDKELSEWVTKTMENKTYGEKNLPMKVTLLDDLTNASQYNVLYAGAESGYLAIELLNSIGKDNILLVTENYDYGTTMINFIINNNKIQYEVNVLKIEQNGLVVDNKLLDQGVDPEGEEEFQRLVKEMRKKLNISQDKNAEQIQKIEKLNKDLKLKEAAIKQKEAYLDSIQITIEMQKKYSEAMRAKLDSNAEQILAKERALKENDSKLTNQMIELEKARKNFQEIERDMSNTMRLLENQKTFTTIAVLVSLLVAILLIVAYRSSVKQRRQAVIINRQKEEAEIQRDEIQTQHLQLADKNKEITDSITYAKRIQDAMLPPLEIFRENLEKSFIFYLPKDIVAGDFYWMEKIENKIIFAAADCTGHGVPGAIVSVICSNALNRSVREFKLTKPSEILNQTLEIVLDKFDSSDDEVKDGMDIALCCYNLETHEIEFAGANNPLWVLRKGAKEVEEYKADKQPIGKYLKHVPFTNHKTKLNKGDTIYVFSDGYADQFGGEMGKKFRSLHFKELLVSIQDHDMKTQKKLVEKAFFGWKGKLDQLDDICVIGFRV